MTTVILLEATVKTECLSTFTALLQIALPDTRAFTGCESVTVHVNQENHQNFVFIERWASRDAYQRYLAWRTENGTLAQLMSVLTEPPSIRYFDGVAV